MMMVESLPNQFLTFKTHIMKNITHIIYTQKIMQKLGSSAQKSLSGLVWIAIIMTLVSAVIFGVTSQYALGFPFIAAFLAVAIIVGAANYYLVSPTKDTKGKTAARIFVGLIISFLTATCVDICVYSDDISEFLHEKQEIKSAEIDSIYSVKTESIQSKIDTLYTQNGDIQEKLDIWGSRLLDEYDGKNRTWLRTW